MKHFFTFCLMFIIICGYSQNVGIGTSAPSAQLHTTGTVRFANYTGGILETGSSGDLNRINAGGANQYLRRNSANTAFEFGQINYSHLIGTPTSLPPNGAAGGDLSGTFPNPILANVGTTGTYNYVTTDAKGRVTSGSLRTLTGTTNQIDVANGNFSANPSIGINPTYSASLKAGYILTGGGNISYISNTLSWSQRFIVLANGRGTHFSTSGYFDITQPADGTVITGIGGASNATVAGGIPLSSWVALYYILPIGSANNSVAANFRLVSYTVDFTIPENWVLIAMRNQDQQVLRLGNGLIIDDGQTWPSGSGVAPLSEVAPVTGGTGYIQNQSTSAQSASFRISGTANVETNYQLDGIPVVFGSGSDVYVNARVLQNNSTTSPDGMYINYNSAGTTNADIKFYANGTTERMRIKASDGNIGIGTAGNATARVSISTNNAELGGAEASNAFKINGGSLGTSVGNSIKLASIGFTSSNYSSLGIQALRTSAGGDWTTTAIGLKYDVDATSPVNGAEIWLHSSGNIGVGTSAPKSKLHVNGNVEADNIWMKVAEVDVVNAANYTFTGLNGNVQKMYKVVFEGTLNAAGADRHIIIRPNALTSSYASYAIYNGSSGGSDWNYTGFYVGRSGYAVNADFSFQYTISALTGRKRVGFGNATFVHTNNNILGYGDAAGYWNNTSTNITSLWIGPTNASGTNGGTLTGKIMLFALK